MQHRLYPLSLTIVALGVAVFGAANCGSDKSPTRPTPSNEPFLTIVEILGPDSIPPGETSRFSVRGRWSDGTEREISTGVTWQSTNTAVVSIDSSGTATGRERGTASLRVSITGSGGATKTVLVLPDGTFRLTGRVTEAGTSGIPVESALVEAGAGADRISTLTSSRGEFTLYGVRRDALLRVAKDGYTDHEKNLQLTAHAFLDVPLELARPRLQLAGTYTFTVGSSQCQGTPALATELRVRTYTAIVTQNNERVTVKLTGRDFASSSGGRADTFYGIVTPTSATFDLREPDYYYGGTQDVVESLPNETFLTISGHAATTPADDGVAGTFNGALVNRQHTPTGALVGQCISRTHTFTLTR